MENRISETVITLSSFYELLLNIGKSFNIQENAEEFLKTLMSQKKLSFSGYFTFEYPNKLNTVYTIPKVKVTTHKIDAELVKDIVKNKFIILNDTHPSFQHIVHLTRLPPNEFVVFFTGIKSIIVLAKKNEAFNKQDFIKYEQVLNHFGLFMESLESHHLIKDEIKIKEEQSEIIALKNEKLEKQNDDLLKYIRSNNELQQFAYRVSHDLNAPLRTIIEFSKLLEKKTGDVLTENQKEYLQFILKSGTQMKELITGILDYSKITGSKLKLKKINVYQLIENIRNLLYHNLTEANGAIVVQKVPEFIVADETKMMQLFLNLISNAIKFKRENVNVKVIIEGVKNEEDFTFSINDNGRGIPLESQANIFDLFNKAENNAEGHGIGLNTCHKIIEQHGGKIWVSSTPNEGTTFHFQFEIMSPTENLN